jgi:argonaute-like protein implicated in RNA metabolism and viral defense
MLATLNELDEEKNRLIFITADGKVSDDELRDFARIQRELEKVSVGVESLKLWVNRTIAEGDIDIEKLQNYQKELD